MLERSFNTVLPFAEDLTKAGIRLMASPNTALGELVSLSTPVWEQDKRVPNHDNEENVASFGMMMGYMTAGEGGALWGASFDNTVETLTNIVNTHVGYIRNTVIPRMLEFAKDSDLFIQELGKTDASSEVEICRAKIPELVQDPSFLGLLEPYKFKTVVKPNNSTLNLPFASDPEDIFAVASLSNQRLDELTVTWNKSNNLNYLESAWHSFFASQKNSAAFKGPYISQDDLQSPDLYVRMNVALAYFLIANYYYSHLPDLVTQETTSSLQRRLYDHMNYAACVLSDSLYRINQNNKSAIMVVFVDTFHKKITVSDEVYERWLSVGGKPEVILGILTGTRRYYSVSEIDSHAKELEQEWNNYSRVYLEDREYQKARLLRDYYFHLFGQYLTSEYEDAVESSYRVSHHKSYKDSMDKAEKYLHGLKKEKLLEVHSVAKHLIAGIKYGFTCALSFVADMEEMDKHVENAIPEEAAMIATINYLVDYVHGQIQVVKNK